MKPDTPMIDKARQLEDVNRELMRFLKWLHETKGLELCQADASQDYHLALEPYFHGGPTFETLVAEFQGIDLAQVAKERKALVDWANRAVTGRCQRVGCPNQVPVGRTLCPDCEGEAVRRL